MGNQSIEIKLQRQGLTEIIRPFNHNKVTGLFKTLVVRNDFLKDRTNPSTPYLFDEVRHSPGKGVLIGLGQVAMTTDEFDVLINNSHRSITDHRSEKADASPLSKGQLHEPQRNHHLARLRRNRAQKQRARHQAETPCPRRSAAC